jgi:hypothetical protein
VPNDAYRFHLLDGDMWTLRRIRHELRQDKFGAVTTAARACPIRQVATKPGDVGDEGLGHGTGEVIKCDDLRPVLVQIGMQHHQPARAAVEVAEPMIVGALRIKATLNRVTSNRSVLGSLSLGCPGFWRQVQQG